MKEYWNDLTTAQKAKYIVASVAGILVVIFAILNWRFTSVHVLFTKVEIPITLLIIMSIAGGFGIATLFDYRKFKKKDKQIKQLKAKLAQKEASEEEQI